MRARGPIHAARTPGHGSLGHLFSGWSRVGQKGVKWLCCSQEAERVQRMDKKLSSLHLDGLVDFSEAAAKFVVLGSTKKHYTITLSDARHTCQCVDFRCHLLTRCPLQKLLSLI